MEESDKESGEVSVSVFVRLGIKAACCHLHIFTSSHPRKHFASYLTQALLPKICYQFYHHPRTHLTQSSPSSNPSYSCDKMSALRTSSLCSLEERRLSRNRKSGSGLKWEPQDDQKSVGELLPDDRHKLDALMNFHLGELDRLRKYVVRLNDDKEQHEVRLASAKHRADGKNSLSIISTVTPIAHILSSLQISA